MDARLTIIPGTARFESDPMRRRTAVAAMRDAGERLLDPEDVERIRNGLGREHAQPRPASGAILSARKALALIGAA